MSEFLKLELPLLVNLPVYQEIHCSQQLTDQLCAYVWEHKPEFIKELAENETFPFPDNRDAMLSKACNKIKCFLKDEASENRVPALSMLGMTDLIYEIDRRVRKALNLFDIPVVGKPLAITPEGPFPDLISLPIEHRWHIQAGDVFTQALADEFTQILYSKAHKLSYAICEQERRILRSSDAVHALHDFAEDIFSKKNFAQPVVNSICVELRRRLSIMCDMPNFEQIKMLAPKGYML